MFSQQDKGLRRDVFAQPDGPIPMAKTRKKKTDGKPRRKRLRRVLIALGILVVIYIIPTLLLLKDARKAMADARVFQTGIANQNLDEVKSGSQNLQKSLKSIKRDFIPFYPWQFIPFLGAYVSDARHVVNASLHGLTAVDIAVKELEPHADILGLKGKNVGQAGTAQERISLMVAALEKITPKFDEVAKEFDAFSKEIAHVNPNRYPKTIKGKKIRENIVMLRSSVELFDSLMKEAKPLAENLPSILGQNQPRTYLLLFQNDKELRPSGGFITAYTYITIDKGKISSSDSDDIYNFDAAVHKVCQRRECPELRPPGLILRYLPEATGQRKTAWDSRDSNIHPDYVASALEFQKFYNIAGGKKIDGIIAMDTYVIRDILAVTGPIKVAGYRTEFNKDNVINELMIYTDIVVAGTADRKALLGDLMSSVMNFVQNAGRDKMQPLLETGINLLNQKHILVFLYDEKSQQAIEKFNWAGRVKEYDGDYFYANDANFASGKANLYVKENFEHKVEFDKDGNVVRTVVVHIEDQKGFNDVLNRNYRNALRLYVPKGSELLASEGSTNKVTVSEEFGKTVFEAFILTRAKGKSTFTITYKIPNKFKNGEEYRLMLQKQPGTDGWEHKFELFGKKIDPVVLKQDQEIKQKI